jgi:site-specific DNA-methyltransferase (adenine-specific)
MVELLNIDCLQYMATLPDKAFDLAIVDPPYGVGDFSQSDAIHRNVQWNNSIPPQEYFAELKRISKKRIIWGANYYNCFEEGNGALVWWKNVGHPSMSHCEIASVSGQQKVDYFHKNWSGGVRAHKSIHPCQKPIELYTYCLMHYAKPNQRILDTHLGSGSSAIAAHYFGCDFVGCEIDTEYFNAAKERFDRETRQVAMF